MSFKISQIFVWTSNDPYTSSNTVTRLQQFRTNRSSYNGNLAHLVTFDNVGGGVAWIGALCSSYGYAFSGVGNTYSQVPTYSWTVEVFAHETGHNMGSQHTQACVWNGNNTAIDGCAPTEGNCPRPGLPGNGGTIMSYCHLTSVGINFNRGFHPQVSSVIQNHRDANSGCLSDCDGGGDGGGDDDDGDGGGDATVYIIQNVNSRLFMHVERNSNSNGADVEQHRSTNSYSQWALANIGGSTYTMINVGSDKSLDIESGSNSNGANVIQWSYNGQNNQKFNIVSAGNGVYNIRPVHSNKCIDVPGSSRSNGRDLIQWNCHSGDNQKWRFYLVNSNQPSTLAGLDQATETSGNVLTDMKVMVRPNPVTEQLNVTTPGGLKGSGTLRLYDYSGKEIILKEVRLRNTTHIIDVTSMAQGVYKLVVEYNNQIISSTTVAIQK